MKPRRELDDEQRKLLTDGGRILRALMPADLGRTGTLDEIVKAATEAASALVTVGVESILADTREAEPEVAPPCPNLDCNQGKKGGARGRSRSGKSLS